MLTAKDFYTAREQNIEARLPLSKAEKEAWKKVTDLWDRFMESGMKDEALFLAHAEAWAQWSILFSWNQALWRQAMTFSDLAHEAWKRDMETLRIELNRA